MRDPAFWQSLAVAYRVRAIAIGLLVGVFSYLFAQWLFIVQTEIVESMREPPTFWSLVYEAVFRQPLTFYTWLAIVLCSSLYLSYMLFNQGRLGERLERLALKDDLTMLYNRRYFLEQLAMAIKRSGRRQCPLSLLLIDLDRFKELNDAEGHLAGDRVLQLVAQTLVATTRLSDTVARYGGEEFTIICEDTSAEQARVLAERIRKAIEEHCPVTGSVGIAQWIPDEGEKYDQKSLIAAADRAMYRAKAAGRNRVETEPSLEADESHAAPQDAQLPLSTATTA